MSQQNETKKVIVDGRELTLEELKEIEKNASIKLKLNEDGTYTTSQRLNG